MDQIIEYDDPDPHWNVTDDKLMALCEAFENIYPEAGFSFGHIVIQDQNWDSAQWAIDHIDDHFESVASEQGYKTALIWRDATLNLLRIIKSVAGVTDDE